MKQLPGWMQQRKRDKSIDPFKDFTIGHYFTCLSTQSTIDDQDCDSKPGFGSRNGSRSSKTTRQEYENSTSELEAKGVDDNFYKETSVIVSERFHGFLTIGTLGTEPITSESATPTFAMSVGNINEEKAEVTEYDLKVINDELEKFLEAEAEEEENIESSGRNSYVSITTLSDKPIHGANFEDCGTMVLCPLQGYLFGSSIELPETILKMTKEKASLAELFHRTKITEESSIEYGKEEMPAKRTHKSVKHLIKKVLKKFHPSSEGPTLSSSDTASVPTKKKLRKVMQMFHRKIHPEDSVAAKKFIKFCSNKINSTPYDGDHVDGGPIHSGKDFPQTSNSKERTQYYMTNKKLPQYGLRGSTPTGSKEHWIKTDADYLVLEL